MTFSAWSFIMKPYDLNHYYMMLDKLHNPNPIKRFFWQNIINIRGKFFDYQCEKQHKMRLRKALSQNPKLLVDNKRSTESKRPAHDSDKKLVVN